MIQSWGRTPGSIYAFNIGTRSVHRSALVGDV
jgi:hypothetical protein